MAGQLPDPPDSFRGSARAFYEALRRMLAQLQPRRLDAEQSTVTFEDETVALELIHRDEDEWVVWADVGPDGAIIQTVFYAHEHFGDEAGVDPDDPDWPFDAVDFVGRILSGRVAVEATLRGDAVLTVRRYVEDDDGTQLSSGFTAFFPRERFFVWRPKRTVVVRPSFR